MDYTTSANVIAALHVKGALDNTLIARLVTAASRTVDRLCTGSMNGDNYFTLADVVNERLSGVVDVQGNILCWPKKAPVNTVKSISYRESPIGGWNTVDLSSNPDLAEIVGPYSLKAWTQLNRRPTRLQLQVSYNGGYADDPAGLPADLVELASLMAGRIYREDEGGLQDAIGIATIGSIQFTKAVPERFEYLLSQFRRSVPYDSI